MRARGYGSAKREYLLRPFRLVRGKPFVPEGGYECTACTANTCREKGSAPFAVPQGRLEGVSRRVYMAGLKPCPSTEPARSVCAEAWFGAERVGAPLAARGKRSLPQIYGARFASGRGAFLNCSGPIHGNFSLQENLKCKWKKTCGLSRLEIARLTERIHLRTQNSKPPSPGISFCSNRISKPCNSANSSSR